MRGEEETQAKRERGRRVESRITWRCMRVYGVAVDLVNGGPHGEKGSMKVSVFVT